LIKTIEFLDNLILNSNYGLLIAEGESYAFFDSANNGIEIDRIYEKYLDQNILSLRIRNTSKKLIRIFSFVVSDFVLPETYTPEKVLENNWLQCSTITYKSLDEITKRNRIFLQRDQNPYSFKKEYGYINDSLISEWFTSIKLPNTNLFIGAVTTANQFSQIYIKKIIEGTIVRVTCQYDGLVLKPGQVVNSEKMFFNVDKKEITEKKFAKSLSHYMHVEKVMAPIKAMCCSYYWSGNKITQETINKELDAINSLPQKLKIDYIQLDAGYTKYFGDWLDYEERFPDGFAGLVAKIKSMGYKAGIWLSPFAINPGTKLHDHNKSWLITDGFKKHFEGRWTSPIDRMSKMLDLEVLDPTKLEVRDYLKVVLEHFKKLGFTLFKLDFMYPVCLASKFSKPVTRAQALRGGIEYVRKILGNECQILSGISPLSVVVGVVDHVRGGIDCLNPFVGGVPIVNSIVNNYMLESDISENENRLFLNGTVWRADPDVLIFRKGTGLNPLLIEKQKSLAVKNNLSLWIGDSIDALDSSEKTKLLRFFNY